MVDQRTNSGEALSTRICVDGCGAVVFWLTSRAGFVVAVVRSNLELKTAGAVVACESLCDRGERTVSIEVEGEKVKDKRYGACACALEDKPESAICVTCRSPPNAAATWIYSGCPKFSTKAHFPPLSLIPHALHARPESRPHKNWAGQQASNR